MDEFQVEVETLEHNFWQLLNLTKRLLARNEVLKAKLNEQTQEFTWRLREIEKENEDFRRKNLLLQKKLSAYECDDVSVVSKDYQEVLMATGNYSELQPSSQQLLENPFSQEIDRDFEDTARNHSESDTQREDTEPIHVHDMERPDDKLIFTDFSEVAKLNYITGYSESSAEENPVQQSPYSNLAVRSNTPGTAQVLPKPFESESSAHKFLSSKENLQNPPAVSNEDSYSDGSESYESDEEPSNSHRDKTQGGSDSENNEESDNLSENESIEEYSENEGE